MIRKNIIIFENQFTQFELIINKLVESNNSDPFNLIFTPRNKLEYNDFFETIKVFIGKKYSTLYVEGKSYKDIAWDIIFEKLKSVELAIIDHKLGSNIDSLNGIDIARKIFDLEINIPILFLSSTVHNSKNKVREYDQFQKKYSSNKFSYDWLEKGFYNENILAKDYINSTIKEKIMELLNKADSKTKETELKARIERLLVEYIKKVVKRHQGLFQKWLDNFDSCYSNIESPGELFELLEQDRRTYIPSKKLLDMLEQGSQTRLKL